MAVLSERYNFLFIHIFKCGGNSVRRALGAPSVGSDVDTLHATELMGAHVDIQDIYIHYKHDLDDSEYFHKLFKFVFVRNPFDWILSTYYYIKSSPQHGFHNDVKEMSLLEFLYWYKDVATNIYRPYGSNKYLKMKDYIVDPYGNVVIDYIARLETINRDLIKIRNATGVPIKEAELVNNNINRKKEWASYYDDDSRKFVETYFEDDLKFFKYNFEGIIEMKEDLHTSSFSQDINVWKQFCELFDKHQSNVIVETGTYLGQSTIDFVKLGVPVHTTEIRQEYQDKAKGRLAESKNVNFYLGDSAELLSKRILPSIQNVNAILFLDAHWYGDNILERELKVLSDFYSGKKNKPVLALHDFKVPGRPEFGFDGYNGRDFEWSWVKPYMDKLYGAGKYNFFYNKELCKTATHNRGCLFIEPK